MDFRIAINLPAPVPEGAPLETLFPRLAAVVEEIAKVGHATWCGYASGVALPDGRTLKTRSGDYLKSITMARDGAFSWRIESENPYALALERGTPAFDMKRWLASSSKVRVSKSGARYLIIPFRWGTPGATGAGAVGIRNNMPEHVHAMARLLRASRVTGEVQAPNVIGLHDIKSRELVTVRRRTYAWGERLKGLPQTPSGRTNPMEGMVRFANPETGRHSTYLTFRTMSERSAGWIKPAMPGYWPARTTGEQLQPMAERAFPEAFAMDMAAILGAVPPS